MPRLTLTPGTRLGAYLPSYPYFEKDPHLASLHGEPDYQAFMKKLRARWEHYQATF